MARRLAVVMDPIATIKPYKDSTLAMLLAAQRRGWQLTYLEMGDLILRDGQALGLGRPLSVFDDNDRWFELGEQEELALGEMDAILMRKDPPFDMEYIYATSILERAAEAGALVVNRPDSLRDCNEKLFTAWFPECCAPTLVTRRAEQVRAFQAEHGALILKPLEGMGGASIFKLEPGDPNTSVVIETLSAHGSRYLMAQRFIPEISAGDKRILLIDGEPVPYALARIPAEGELRGNLAAGGRGVGIELSARDREICQRLGPELKARGLMFVGIDVIGDYLTEINVTSPTCIRELDAQYGLDIAGDLIAAIEAKLDAEAH